MARLRSAKRLGTRHDLNYFKHWSRMRRARAVLALGIPFLALIWVLGATLTGEDHPASSGLLARAHSFIGNDCGSCHAQIVDGVRKKGFIQHANAQACITCHAAPPHKVTETFTPTCGSCHLEHKGSVRLAQVGEGDCTQCHANLQSKSGKLTVAAHIQSFNADHPEFAALRTPFKDPGTIAFNHAVHMKGVLALDGKRYQLECVDCHRSGADQNEPWRFAATGFMPPANSKDRAYMVAPTYEGACAGCHDLRFDPNIKEAAPHDKPEVVLAFLQKIYSGQRATAPAARPARFIPSSAPRAASTPTERLSVATRLLWGKTCKECHQLSLAEESPAALPTVAESKITAIWLPKGKFNHESHRSFTCVSCHEKATGSTQTAEVLVPAIATCKSCHNGDPLKAGRVENRCFECHDYHDWSHQPAFHGRYTFDPAKRSQRN